MTIVKDTIKSQINQVLKKKYRFGSDLQFQIEYPPAPNLGDYSSNLAMVLAKKLKKSPMEIGKEVASELISEPVNQKMFTKIEVVKPGFVNFYLSEGLLKQQVKDILKNKGKYGQLKPKKKLKIQIEFISANPTGPLTLANGRGGFSGDVLANVLELAGHKVEREYYVNDYGEQIKKLGHSILKDKLAVYSGAYIDELYERLKQEKGVNKNDANEVGIWGAGIILEEMIKPTVQKAQIKFDHWFSEREMHQKGEVDKMLSYLKKHNLAYEKDGAWWLKTANQGDQDDKDRVLVKSNGDKTYFLADIAYHWNKFYKRKFDKVINLWGADHHGYVPRMKSAMAMLGYPGQPEVLLMQLVRLVQDGKEVRMSKRHGIYVLLDELIDEVGLDVARFFFLMHANNKAMDFDLNLARERSQKNPVYYVQYAHARICSILKKTRNLPLIKVKAYELCQSERELIKELIKWPELVQEVAQSYEVHKIPFYVISLADKFHDLYEKRRIIEEGKVIEFRLNLIQAAKQVLQNAFKVLGISAPEKM